MKFKGQIIYFVRDRYNCVHMLKRNSQSAALLEQYIYYIETLKKNLKSEFVRAFIVNLDEPNKPFIWCSNKWLKDINDKISPNHQKYLNFLSEHREDVFFIGPYKSMRSKGLHVCSKGHEWRIQPIKVKEGEKCPKCKWHMKESNGAKFITNLLSELNIMFIKELQMKRLGLESEYCLDFTVIKNNHAVFVIEFNGIQHYKPIRNEFFGGYEGYRKRKRSDKNKRDFCWSNALPVIDIPYAETEEQMKETIEHFCRMFYLLD
ncbi:hypothetical protein [Saliterribacillus persicus]|uniref:DUF2726 domain-containing protein n=1 Tax=Saliterribacillus persicus TaxID=930114 RepID=A0A368X5B9_9BACI|nr:hypothetical protein [Saliterribacillus persicus]RCW63133.1 hypothetical protein DFR57_1199 [Saliterribacillus persicus]